MMKEIFQLHRFDLQDKTRSLTRENKSLLDHTEGQLKGYEMVTDDEIKEGQKELIRQEKFLNDTEKNHRLIDEKFQKLKRLKDDFEVLEKKKKEWKELRSEEHTSELQSRGHLVCRLLLEKKKNNNKI